MSSNGVYLVKANGERILVSNRNMTLARRVDRLRTDNRSKSRTIKILLAVSLTLVVALATVIAVMGSHISTMTNEISTMADENLKQVTYIADEYRALYNEHRELEQELLNAQDLIAQYEQVFPMINNSWEYYNPEIPLSANDQAATYKIGAMYGIEPEILYGIMKKESGFDPSAISRDGHDYGLCQIRDVNHSWLESELGDLDFMKAEDSILAAAFIISDIRDTYGYTDWNQILVVYNMGPGNAKEYFATGQTSTGYSRLVMEYAAEFGYSGT